MTLIEQLKYAAREIRDDGHLGWGNVCDDAANRIAEMEKLREYTSHKASCAHFWRTTGEPYPCDCGLDALLGSLMGS